MQTKIIGGGLIVPGVEWGIDPTFQAGRVSIRPYDYAMAGQTLGHYRVIGQTAAIAPAANSILFNMRWAQPQFFAVLMRLSASITVVTAVTAQRTDPLVATIQRAYTANETTNITAVTPSGNTGKARQNMGTSLMAQVAVASAAAGISGGTRTPDGAPFTALQVAGLGAIGSGLLTDDLIRYDVIGAHPETLSNNEGLTVAWGPTALATGTVVVTFIATWAEVVAF